MHEHSLMKDLMSKIFAVAHEQGGTTVSGVKVRLGALAHISAEHFKGHFVEAARGTSAEGARLDVELMEDANDPLAQEIVLDSVEIEE